MYGFAAKFGLRKVELWEWLEVESHGDADLALKVVATCARVFVGRGLEGYPDGAKTGGLT